MTATNTRDKDNRSDIQAVVPAEQPPALSAKTRVGRYRYAGNGSIFGDTAGHELTGQPAFHLFRLMGGVLELLIAFRIFLKAIGANPQAGFANFIYGVTDPFLAPFSGLISNPSNAVAVLEISSLIALVAYAILIWLVSYTVLIFWNR